MTGKMFKFLKVHFSRFRGKLGQHLCDSDCFGEYTMEESVYSPVSFYFTSDLLQTLSCIYCVERVCMRPHMGFCRRNVSKDSVSHCAVHHFRLVFMVFFFSEELNEIFEVSPFCLSSPSRTLDIPLRIVIQSKLRASRTIENPLSWTSFQS